MENIEQPYKLHPETYQNLLGGGKENAELLEDEIELIKRSIDLTEKANTIPDIILVDDEGVEVQRLSMPKRGTGDLKQRLLQKEEQLITVKNFIQELVDENEEIVAPRD